MVIYYFIYILLLVYIFKVQRRALHMVQQNLYNENNRYLKWIFKNFKITILNIGLLSIIVSFLLIIYKNDIIKSILLGLLMIIYLLAYFYEKKISKNNQNKKPLVYTKRVKRLLVTINLIYLILILLSLIFTNITNILLLIITILSSQVFLTVYLSNIINYPIERLVYKYFESKAKNKLHSMKNLKVIGITGSYGKTSSKNILNDILNIKYNCLATPKSLNTFNGLMITINNDLTKFDDIFIAEMGAYVKGEIKGLCKLVEPKYGIITSIGTAHLETFGSEENIISGKMELIESLPLDGVGVLNKDDEKQIKYKIKNKCKILWIGIKNKDVDVYATNIKNTGSGTSFDVIFKGDKKKYTFETRLLGKHNIYNILSSIALGYELNISIKDLQTAVRKVKPIEHRLEVKKLGNFYQIDDAYNSNPVGAESALDVLKTMDGLKVVVTPGMIELGEKEYELNKKFGKQISHSADKVILIGEKRTKPIYDGLIEEKFNKNNIYILNDVRESYILLNKLKGKEDLYALYENDLPDTYSEK